MLLDKFKSLSSLLWNLCMHTNDRNLAAHCTCMDNCVHIDNCSTRHAV